jgi:hypothetical protein
MRLEHYLETYYEYLGASVFMVREKEFWAFHREKMDGLGYPLSMPRLVAAVCARIMDYLLNPKRTVERLLRKPRKLS